MTYRSPEEPDEYPVYLRNASNHLSRVEPGRPHLVGRDARCDVVLIDPSAEWQHATVVVEGMGLRVIAQPNAATYVDDARAGEEIASSVLARSGSKIRMGATTLVVETGARVEQEHEQTLARRREVRKVLVPRPMSGELEEIPLPDLLALFETSKKTGILMLRRHEGPGPSGAVRPEALGQIHLERGNIIHTVLDDRAATDEAHARAMVMEMLSWQRGVFELEPPREAPRRTVLLEGTELTLAYNARRRSP